MSATTRRAATASRKDQITRAAIALLAERGFHATTFEAICERAGLSSKRLITYHFSSKDELFAAVAARVVADAEAYIRPAVDAAPGPRARLATFIRSNVAFMADHLDQMRALQQIILNGGRAWDQYHAASVQHLAGLFADGRHAGAFRACDPRIMGAALRASLDSMYQLLAEGLDSDHCANELVEVFDRAALADDASGATGPRDDG